MLFVWLCWFLPLFDAAGLRVCCSVLLLVGCLISLGVVDCWLDVLVSCFNVLLFLACCGWFML